MALWVGRSQQGAVAAVEDRERRFYGLDYHPEVDEIFIQSIKDAGIYNQSGNAFAVCLYHFEHKFLDEVDQKICNRRYGMDRVVQDITSKPPSAIEWE
ncbi:hypothetical protein CCACVL1_24400 [Corchorus capsularis]|uniref:GMP synthase C-terminal domain-containing protein n=1 Tax=Corchorus capsularis TaxID=210143 RepID=A0A1R3GPX5_COCAP|nr:hypothetical protein CCACVL1_24400 [Corchorus capsularis]